jgi:GR25 family glycosyltransferase involved in LPS biosynthesis
MTSLLERFRMSLRRLESRLGLTDNSEDGTPDIFKTPEKPYIMCSVYYLAILLFIGLPIWFYTCSQTRYSLPELTKLEDKLSNTYPRLHLDISVVQFVSPKSNHDPARERQSDYLRANLPTQFSTSIEGLVYDIDWRIRRPTQEENHLMKAISKENTNQSTKGSDLGQILSNKLEENLLKIHKPTNRFRLFMYLFEEPINSLICDRSQSYIVNYERFIYLCPDGSDEHLVALIKESLNEVYFKTVDLERAKKILGAKTDLLVSLISENDQKNLTYLSEVADKVHAIYDKNVKSKFLELTEVLNIRLITQNIFDLLANDALDSMVIKSSPARVTKEKTNTTDSNSEQQVRILDLRAMSRFYNSYEMRLNKHSSQSVNHVVTLLPDSSKSELTFDTLHSANYTSVKMLEERDSNFILIGDGDKSLVLGMRAIVRRIIGLKSPNLCLNCQARKNVFLNKWELDAIVGVLTVLKLESVLISLRSISQQTVGIRIPKYVSTMVYESHESALKALDSLATKKPLEAYRQASTAYELSETAYYDPSLLETSYYPRETRWAIYTPLTLPLVLPILMSIIRIGVYLLRVLTSDGSQVKQKSQ